jgi:polyferredoxin
MRRHFTPSNLRLAAQGGFALFLAWTCLRFVEHARWAMGLTDTYSPKPPAVEGFLPISALMAAKRLLLTGGWDPVHPAGLAIFLAICGMALVFRKGFCGQLCPVGFASSLLERLGRRLRLRHQPGAIARRILAAPKYVLFAAFAWVSFSMSVHEIGQFLRSPFNLVADTKMLLFFAGPSALTIVVIVVLAALSVVIPAFWCRTLCPYGALLGLLGWFSPTAVTRDADACVSCGRCARACPTGLPVDARAHIDSPECQGCLECVSACPVKGCLGVRMAGRRVPWWTVAVGCLVLLIAASVLADALGLWRADLPPQMVRRMHMIVLGGGGGF